MTVLTNIRFTAGIVLLLLAGLSVFGCGQAERPYMVALANRHAGEAAVEILKQGGSALDAAIAAQLVLTLVEPQSSGIGGGAYLMYWDRHLRKISAYDGRETAPRAATPRLFLKPGGGGPMGFFEALMGGRAVGAPGVIDMFWQAHKAHGKLAWARLFEPAIRLAEAGFRVSPMLHKRIVQRARFFTHPSARDYFLMPDPAFAAALVPVPVGHKLKNPALARSLRIIADKGRDGFYRGEIARAMVAAVKGHSNPGLLSLDDLGRYRAKKRVAVCAPYRKYTICGMPPSTSGGVTVLQIMGLLQPFSMSRFTPGSPMAIHLISEASKLAYADRARYMGDADFAAVPVAGLIDRHYLRKRARLIHPGKAARNAPPGIPPGVKRTRFATGLDLSQPSTSHLTIADRQGNVVSMTTSVEYAFGAHIMAGGFILNNQLTDFSFRPTRAGKPVANAVAGGKRPRSSMAPTLVFDASGRLFAALGSPGSSRIIVYVAQTLVALLDWNMNMQAAIALPHHVNLGGTLELEAGTRLVGQAEKLRALGHKLLIGEQLSGLHGIRFTAGGLDGGADPRREGVVLSGR